MIRHGDVLLMPCSREEWEQVRREGKVVENEPRGAVLAYGEVTGHAHVVESPRAVQIESKSGARYLLLPEAAPLTHQEHGIAMPVVDQPYRVIRQVEWTDEQEPRKVAD